ncbi:MAG: hypothetical protein HY978_02875 [Candidatus Liptonbacteria bacterium]|nr:hypothetical protein [Candidatus Liptonbacteria bacterium]
MTERQNFWFTLGLMLAVVLDLSVWWQVVRGGPSSQPRLHFLSVGQGDSELLELPGGVNMLFDAGPDATVVRKLERVLPPARRTIDLALITHPQLDHYNGYRSLIGRYQIGAFLVNGRDDSGSATEWRDLMKLAAAQGVPTVTLGAGDRIRVGRNTINILAPDAAWRDSAELNDTGLVAKINTSAFRALLLADIDAAEEEYLATRTDLAADILKLSHHGSKFSSSEALLKAVNPRVVAVEVGARNRYGHPSPETLARVATSTTARIFRTDRDGTITITGQNNVLQVTTQYTAQP